MAARPVRRCLPQCTESRCGIALAAAAQRRHYLSLYQYVNANWRILDTGGGGQYGPRGFEGGEDPGFPRLRGCRPMSDSTRKRRKRKRHRRSRPLREAQASRRTARPGQVRAAPPMRPASRTATDHSALARGFRLSSELVAGVLVGAGIGWLIDRWLGTLPWGMFVFALLGFAAGVLNVMRSAGVVAGGVPDSTIERRKNSPSAATRARGRRDDRASWPIRSISSRSTRSFTLGQVGGQEIAFTNSSLFMVIARRADRRAADRHDRLAQRRAGRGCNRSPSSPTSSSPPR